MKMSLRDPAQVAFDIYEHETRRMLTYQRLMYSETNMRRRRVWEDRLIYHREKGREYFQLYVYLTQ